ncbi:MAG: LemA family protein [Bacilli bacterium]|nr:LemA family protein [Bacilli bacterium]
MDLYLPAIIILISLLLIGYILIYNTFQRLIIRIGEAEANISGALDKRFDLLNRAINIIKGNVKIDKEILENIVKLRSRKLSDFEMDKELDAATNQFYILKDEYPDLNKSSNFGELCESLNDTIEQLAAAKKYYNNIVVKYNKLVRLFPSSIVAFILRYKEKGFHDEIDNMEYVAYNEK